MTFRAADQESAPSPGRQLVIILGGFGRRLGAADRVDLGVREFFHGERLTCIPLRLWALILVDRDSRITSGCSSENPSSTECVR